MGDSYIIAIDFGTSYSGYAFSMTERQGKTEPNVKMWGEEVGLETPKTPTCILFDENENFLSFGYEAKQTYLNNQGSKPRSNLFFNCFKMLLYDKKLKSNFKIKAANGKSMTGLKVFTEALRYLKDDALRTISENTVGRHFIASDFTWVLTVPAIWGQAAKQFMRKAANQAGIVTEGQEEKFVIALEPEAASLWCKNLPADRFIENNNGDVKLGETPGTKYIVVDCGGGTTDITVHEVLHGGALKELHKASGNDLGGDTVDRKFHEFLRKIFCDGVWDEFEEKFPSDVQRLIYEFTLFKRRDDDVEISCPFNLGKLAEKKKEIGKFFESVQGASWDEGSIKISKEKLRSFFVDSLNGITDILREIPKENLNLKYIVLVGGYAQSKILRQHVINKFGDQCKVLCPLRPQEAIVKGAVIFGRNTELVASRKSAYTYGIEVRPWYDELKHKADKKFTDKDGVWCADVFFRLVKIDEDVRWNETREYIFSPPSPDTTGIAFRFFQTKIENPKYVDEDGVEKIGSFHVKSPDITRGLRRKIKLEILLGFTEIRATATDIDSGSNNFIELDFMNK